MTPRDQPIAPGVAPSRGRSGDAALRQGLQGGNRRGSACVAVQDADHAKACVGSSCSQRLKGDHDRPAGRGEVPEPFPRTLGRGREPCQRAEAWQSEHRRVCTVSELRFKEYMVGMLVPNLVAAFLASLCFPHLNSDLRTASILIRERKK